MTLPVGISGGRSIIKRRSSPTTALITIGCWRCATIIPSFPHFMSIIAVRRSTTEYLRLDFSIMVGTFILSLDTEIAWGTDAVNLPRYAYCFDNYPNILRRLIDLLSEYEIPTTWAVVGQLMLFANASTNRQPRNWYHAPYIVEWIRAAKTAHEIGTHTFSHIYTYDPQTTQAVWEADLVNCLMFYEHEG